VRSSSGTLRFVALKPHNRNVARPSGVRLHPAKYMRRRIFHRAGGARKLRCLLGRCKAVGLCLVICPPYYLSIPYLLAIDLTEIPIPKLFYHLDDLSFSRTNCLRAAIFQVKMSHGRFSGTSRFLCGEDPELRTLKSFNMTCTCSYL
jgi:hypothetical protein